MAGTDALHSALTGSNIHVPYRFSYADAAAREAEAGAVPGDVGCLALQQADNSLWMLTDDDPLTWVQIGYGAPPADHDHSGDAGDGGTFDAANLTSGASTDGQVLTSDGAGNTAWEDPALVKIAEVIVAGADAASIAFNSIPGTYRHLMLMVTGRYDEAVGLGGIQCQFNGDTGTNYAHQRVTGNAATPSAVEGTGTAFLLVGWLSGSAAGANYAAGSTAWIYDYARTQWYKHVDYVTGQHAGLTTGMGRAVEGAGVWANTAAITAILLYPQGTSTKFLIGTVATLYGLA